MQRQSATLEDGRTVSFLEAGPAGAPALVLLHGIGSAATSWTGQLDGFADRFRVIAWDAPGYGGSDPLPAEAPTAADYAAVLDAFLAARAVRDLHLVGSSLGGIMAAAYARRDPTRLLSLTLADCAAGHANLPAAERAAKLANRLDGLAALGPTEFAAQRAPRMLSDNPPAAALETVRAAMAALRPDGYAQAARMLAGADIFADLAVLAGQAPRSLVLVGGADRITPPAGNRSIAAALPGARFVELPGLGHAAHVEGPDAFNAALAAFLEDRP